MFYYMCTLFPSYSNAKMINEMMTNMVHGTLTSFSVADNPNLCMKDSCEKKNFILPLVASLSALIVILLISLGLWIFRRPKGTLIIYSIIFLIQVTSKELVSISLLSVLLRQLVFYFMLIVSSLVRTYTCI